MFGLNRKPPVIRPFWLYIIALEQGKFYIGITRWKDPNKRIKQHGTKSGAAWTRKYKPLKPLKVERLVKLGFVSAVEAERCENEAFEEYRVRHGLQNVRGGNVTSSWPVYRIGSVYFGYEALSAFGSLVLVIILAILIYIISRH